MLNLTAQWNGHAIILEIDYDRYFILKHCPFKSNKRKYAPFECMADWYKMRASSISYKLTIGFICLSVNQSVISFSHPHRTTGQNRKIFKIFCIPDLL